MSALVDCYSEPQKGEEISSKKKVVAIAKSLERYTIQTRRFLHQIPELGWEEEKTLAFIKNEIYKAIENSRLTFNIQEKEGGIWVDVYVDHSLPHLLFRADIDALPIEEKTDLPFSSKHPGKMHACGHDCHAAMLLSAFYAIAQGHLVPSFNLRFLWQRAEEFWKARSGGKQCVQDGVLEGIDEVYGLHISSTHEAGVFYSTPGVMMANAAYFTFGIECSGGHVMRPDLGTNAISILMDIQNSLRGFEGLYFQPDEPIAFVPSIIHSGSAINIRPNSAEMSFSLRNFLSEEVRDKFISDVKRRISLIIESYPTARLAFFDFNPCYPCLKNDRSSYEHVVSALDKYEFKIEEIDPLFSGEDFTYYLQKCPGAFWILGAKQEPGWDHHTPYFNPDETYLWQGVAYWLILSQESR